MKSGKRLALMLWLALVANAGFGASSLAQKSETAALNAGITELSQAGKYSEAIPLAQRLPANLEQAFGLSNRDVAAALNNLACSDAIIPISRSRAAGQAVAAVRERSSDATVLLSVVDKKTTSLR